ncbi:MAG: AAA family ATPase, partial [Chloroflexota bacterium]|nr:AAA family ATPase [Chloroflexota bacterium]
KHLVLQGYKSFAAKTEFLFPTGITAIVGPNGSGKSNIADGIRWVLGERSMRALRGKSTADMIFAGGRRRARAGMAEVSLTLDNSDGWLPIDFSEVTIARRAYRSGDNEYIINGARVRLRDITELLAESGLSERTYTVIGQGLVDAALSLRPQERRSLFEEAAGISLYRTRREKAVERLDETGHNLERVHDIIIEITPRLRRLEREAAQVEEYRRVVAHQKRLQRTWYGYRWGRQQAALDESLKKAAFLESSLEEQQQEMSALDERLTQLRQREHELRAELRDWHRESADLHDRANEIQRKLAVAEERARLLKVRREELLAEIEPLSAQQKAQAEQVDQTQSQVEQLEREMGERKQRLAGHEQEWSAARERAQEPARRQAQAERELRAHRDRLERLNQALIEARAEAARLESERAVAEERAQQLRARREEMMNKLEPLGDQQGAQSRRITQARAHVERLERAQAEREQRAAKLEREWAAAQQQARKPDRQHVQVEQELDAHRAQLEQVNESLVETRAEAARLAGEQEALDRIHADSAAYDTGVRALLQAKLDGVIGPLATLIQVPPRWERAVEAALSADLQAVVVERSAVVEQARRILESAGGRLTLLPLDGMRPAPPLPSGAVSAARVVTGDGRARAAVEALLGGVALCDDLATASALLPAMPIGGRCVTPTGVVLRADGALSLRGDDTGGLLADERARRELPARRDEVHKRRQELDQQREAEAKRIAALEARLEELARQTAEAREEAAQARRERLERARTEVAVAQESLRNQQAILQREHSLLKELQSQEAALRKQADALGAERAAIVARVRTLQAETVFQSEADVGQIANLPHHRCREIEKQQQGEAKQIAALETRLEELAQRAAAAAEEAARFERETLGAARTEVAVAGETLRSRQAALQREESLLEQLRAQRAARRQRTAELEAEQAAIGDSVRELRAENAQMEAQLLRVRERIQPAEDELARQREEQTSLEKKEQQARNRAREWESRHSRAQLEVARRHDALDSLKQRIEEDLGLVELELAESVTAQTTLPMRPLVSQLPVVEELPEGLEEEIQRIKARTRRLGRVNPNAPDNYAEVQERHQFLTEQSADLETASEKLRKVVAELDELMEAAFRETFDAIAVRFSELFPILFEGGVARLELTEPDDLLNSGVDIIARPPGKRAQRLALLSGGERSLTASALLFAILHVSPTPFCVLDEVDAALDEANVGRFRALLEELAQQTQFIIITHNRGTIEAADTIYGVSMGADGVSQMVSLKVDRE